MPEPLITFSPSSVTIEGKLFEGDAAVRMKNALAREVGILAVRGRQRVAARIRTGTKHGTGYTARNVEVHRTAVNSLFATIRLPPDLERQPGTTEYPASRRPYIVNAVLESGRYRGHRLRTVRVSAKTGRARMRTNWQSGNRRQRGVFAWRDTARWLRVDAARVRAQLIAKELE